MCREAADGGTLGIVQDGDVITLDVYNRSCTCMCLMKKFSGAKKPGQQAMILLP
jgi:dihydroxyacid dehydratase/phosphogluconate dehydratase